METKSRPIKELLTVLLNNKDVFIKAECNGLCKLTDILYRTKVITVDEAIILTSYIYNKRPKIGKHFDKDCRYYLWYWSVKDWTPREAWLKTRIRKP